MTTQKLNNNKTIEQTKQKCDSQQTKRDGSDDEQQNKHKEPYSKYGVET